MNQIKIKLSNTLRSWLVQAAEQRADPDGHGLDAAERSRLEVVFGHYDAKSGIVTMPATYSELRVFRDYWLTSINSADDECEYEVGEGASAEGRKYLRRMVKCAQDLLARTRSHFL